MEKEQWNDTRNLRQKVNKALKKSGIKPTPLLITAINVRKRQHQCLLGAQYFALPGPSTGRVITP